MRKGFKTLLIWGLLIGVCIAFLVMKRDSSSTTPIDLKMFMKHVENGDVATVRIDGNEMTATLYSSDIRLQAHGVASEELITTLGEHGVRIDWGKEKNQYTSILILLLPILLLIFFLLYFIRKAQGGAGMGNVLSLMKSRARLVPADESQITFADVGGCEEAKELLGDVIDFLKNPGRWTDAGARLPRGVLLEGPPGCGKTLLARAVAGETNAKFFLVSASEFVEMFVGVGAARVRDTFEMAVKQAPSVVFIDEFDAVGRRRGSGIGSGHDEREQTLNQLLVCLDGFESNVQVVVIGATNRPDILDQALLRPGRFDRRIKIPPLTTETRLEILKIHTRNKTLSDGVDFAALAEQTDGLNGAQLENLANEAALFAVRRNRMEADIAPIITTNDFDKALVPVQTQAYRFDKLDSVLIESATQLTEPTGNTRVRLTLKDGSLVEGKVIWADASFLKIDCDGEQNGLVVPKVQIHKLEALFGTETSDSGDIAIDQWAGRTPDLA